MSEKTCATCHFHGTQTRETTIEIDGEYRQIELPHRNCLPPLTEPAIVVDGSGYSATLWTLPTFSCSLWEIRKR